MKKRELFGIIIGGILTASGVYVTAFVYTYSEWRPTAELADIGFYSTTIFSAKLWQAGAQFRGTYDLYTFGSEEEYPYVNYSSSPRLRVYDQTENLILSLALQPDKRIRHKIDVEESGYYTFEFEGVQLRPSCYIVLKAYTNEEVYPYRGWWVFPLGLLILGIATLCVSLRRCLPTDIHFKKKNKKTT